ncbi:hypothetical protein FB451DRAFT_1260511 [Mycena latifolia]|nr:hypothetical protein FB451DRAFT_1260511 [Mycena latifolia]
MLARGRTRFDAGSAGLSSSRSGVDFGVVVAWSFVVVPCPSLSAFFLGADSRTPHRHPSHLIFDYTHAAHRDRPSFTRRSLRSLIFHHGQQAPPPPRHPVSASFHLRYLSLSTASPSPAPALVSRRRPGVLVPLSFFALPSPYPPRRSPPAGGPVCTCLRR